MKYLQLIFFQLLFTVSLVAQNDLLEDKLNGFIDDAKFHQLNGQYKEAVQKYQTYLSYRDNDEVYLWLSQAYYQLDNYNLASENINKSIELNGTSDLAYFTRANILMDLGDTYSAINDYTASTLLNPNNMYSYMQRAFAFSAVGLHDEAIRDFAIAIQINPIEAKAYYRMAAVDGIYEEGTKVCTLLPMMASTDNLHAELVYRTFCL